jgi:mannose-6-phosphate isomerase-like protein (cupin superfamily)
MESAIPCPIFIAPGSGDRLTVIRETVTVKLRGSQTGGAYSVLEEEMPPGCGVPLHVHRHEDEGFYVLEGQYEFRIGDEIIRAEVGSCLFAPRDIPHMFRNIGDRPARLLVTLSPPGFEVFFEEMDRRRRNGPVSLEEVAELGHQYGLDILA